MIGNKLAFGEKNTHVIATTLKILKSMKRDWMIYGRRPSGLCGAAILISARCHGFKRTTQQIIKVVHVCDETIRRRLEEFSLTESAKLTKEEFDKIIIDENDPKGIDPPCFIRLNAFHEKKAKDIENFLSNDNTSLVTNSNINNEIISTSHKTEERSFVLQRTPDLKQNMINYDNLNENLSDLEEDRSNIFILSSEEYQLKKNALGIFK